MTELTRPSSRGWLLLPAAVALALLWRAVFPFYQLICLALGDGGPALGVTAVTAAIWAAVLLFLGKSARWNAYNIFLAAGALLLALCCAVYGDASVRAVNCVLILCASALAFFSLSGVSGRVLTDARCTYEAVGLALRALFTRWGEPFRLLGSLFRGDGRGRVRGVALGALCALPLLLLCGALLASADAVFSGVFGSFADWLAELDALSALFKALDTLFFTLCFFSAIFFLCHPPAEGAPAAQEQAEESPERSAVPYVTALTLLCALYALFAAVQFEYLFGGAEAAAMEGGWAEYARSGFMQLVLVAAVDLAVLLFCAVRAGHSRAVRVLCLLLAALTAVILASAFWRMRLYILAYGLSVLRAMTLWAMAFILCCLALASVKALRPGFRFWPWFAAIGLAGWIGFNLCNVDARVAGWNVDAYLAGELEIVDTAYLAGLSPDVLPALRRLLASEPTPELVSLIAALESHAGSDWTEWSLSNVRYG